MTLWKWVVHGPSSRFVYSVRGGDDPEPRYDVPYSVFGDECWTPEGELADGYFVVTIESDEKADRRTERYSDTNTTFRRSANAQEIEEYDHARDVATARCVPFYQRRVLAFIDILGWGALVERTAADPEELERLKSALNFLSMPVHARAAANEFFDEAALARMRPLDAAHFSDTVVISGPTTPLAGQQLILDVKQVCRTLLTGFGHYTRGAIVVDQIYHEDNLVFGPALNRAYRIGERENRLPRVLVSPEALPFVVAPVRMDEHTVTTDRGVERDADGSLYVDILAWPSTPRTMPRMTRGEERLIAEVQERLANDPCEAHRPKHEWMLNYLEGSLREREGA